MKRIAIFFVAGLGLLGCDKAVDDLSSRLFGKADDVFVLSGDAFEVSQDVTTFHPEQPVKISGNESSICLVLTQSRSLNAAQMDEQFRSLTNDARIKAVVTTISGRSSIFRSVAQSWTRIGRILPGSEIAACLGVSSDSEQLPVGTEVANIEVSSDKPFTVRGAYWTSTTAARRRN